jgi:Short C-terminal domain
MAAAMIGGTAHMAHKAGQRSAEAQQREYDQEARLQELEAQQQPQYAPPPPPAYAPPPPAPAAPAAGGVDIAGQLQQLAQLRDQGVLSPAEFDAAKQKLLGG